jgi:tRNA(adenine34) deaminase
MADADWMTLALAEADAAAGEGEVPVGCVIVSADGRELGRGRNAREGLGDPTAHAEMLAIRAACAEAGSERLPGCDIHVTLEPCPMCAAAISFARLRRLYFGASDPKMGGVENGPRIFSATSCQHRPEIYGGIRESEGAELLRAFFKERR